MTRDADESAVSLPVRAVFFGSGAFALPILAAARRAPEVEIVAVVSTPDRPAGRRAEMSSTPVAAAAREGALPLLQPASLREAVGVDALASLAPDLGILADYGRIVPPDVLAAFPRGILNVHPSLLPLHRGASPIPAAILAGDREVGVSLIELIDRLDAGPIVASRSWAPGEGETAATLEAACAVAGARLLTEHLAPWLAGTSRARPQDDAGATLTRPLRREDGRLDPTQPASRLERMVRAYAGWPGTFFEVGGLRISALGAGVRAGVRAGAADDGHAAGRLVALDDGLGMATSDGILELVRVQPAGGRPMTGAELLRGRPSLLGATVGR